MQASCLWEGMCLNLLSQDFTPFRFDTFLYPMVARGTVAMGASESINLRGRAWMKQNIKCASTSTTGSLTLTPELDQVGTNALSEGVETTTLPRLDTSDEFFHHAHAALRPARPDQLADFSALRAALGSFLLSLHHGTGIGILTTSIASQRRFR